MTKHYAFLLILCTQSTYIVHTANAKNELVTPQEILTLKSKAQNLLKDHTIQKKTHELKIKQIQGESKIKEQQKLVEIEQGINELEKQIQRLQEIVDMPLSRPEAEHITSQLKMMEAAVLERHKRFHD